MTRYALRRLAAIVLILFLVSVIVFAAIHILPGNAATLILGEYATPEAIRTLEREMGLDRPLLVQYTSWISSVVTGDWGTSLAMKQPVTTIVASRLRNSAFLAFAAFTVVVVVGIPLGTLAALRQGRALDLAIVTATYVGISIPEFVTGLALLLALAGPSVGWFPTSGYAELTSGIAAWARHLVLPALTLTSVLLAHVVRQTRSGLAAVLTAPYIRTVRLKGASTSRIILRHALRNALLPTITVLALDLGYLMGGIVVVEEVFAYPGMGRLIIYAVQNRDVPLLQMCALVVACVYVLANFAADLTYAWLDPRIRYS